MANLDAKEIEQLAAPSTAVEPVHGMLTDLAETVDKQRQLEAWLEQDPQYAQLVDARVHIAMLEEKIKEYMKELNYDRVEQSGYEAIMVVRHGKGAVTYDLPAIEAQPWGAGCIVKAVNATVFKAIVTSLNLDMNLFATTEPG